MNIKRLLLISLAVCLLPAAAWGQGNTVGSTLDPADEIRAIPEGVEIPAGAPWWAIHSVYSTGCFDGDYGFNTTFYAISDPTYVNTIAEANGLRYMNEQFDYIANWGAHAGPRPDDWYLFDISSGGPTNGTWPIPSNTPVTIDFYLRDSFDGPIQFHRQVVIERCNGGGIISDQVISNPDGGSRATFSAFKDYNDGNPGETAVTLSCTTGLPLEQTKDISEAQGVEFVVVDFDDGEMDCTITEEDQTGYSVSYFNGVTSSDGCQFDNVQFGAQHACDISNDLNQVTIDVTKIWFDEHPEFNKPTYARADYSCSGEQFGDAYGSLPFYGEVDEESFYVYPHWNGLTTCTVTEAVFDSAVISDDSDCSSVSVTLGVGNECTITNTVFYQGIPTLSQYGLAVLALLMLGVGLVGFRRFA